MIMRYLVLKDFRQFFGEQRVDFAEDPRQNVTVIYGHNGAGKTTILNAFTWTLFDKTTPAFENPRNLANERALYELEPGKTLEVFVRVSFEHNERIYDVKKTLRVSRDTGGEISYGAPRFNVTVQAPGQGPEAHENVTEIIGQIMPADLYNFFFFDGERMEHIVKEDESKELEGAVKIVLGLEVLEKALKHIPAAKRILKTNLARYGKGSAVEQLLQQSKTLEAELGEKRDTYDNAVANRHALELTREKIDSDLRVHEATREKQALIDQLEARESDIRRALGVGQAEVRKLISRDGFTAFCEHMSTKASTIADELRKKGQLPAAYQRRFVQDLLNAGACICGTPIMDHGPQRERVEALLDAGGRSDIEQGLDAISALSGQYLVTRARLYEDVSRFTAERSTNEGELRSVRERLNEERRKLGEVPDIDTAALTQKRGEVQRQIDELGADIRIGQGDIARLEGEVQEVEKKISAANVSDEKARAIQTQMDSATRIEKALKEILDLRRSRARAQLDSRIKTTYSKITYKDYQPELDDLFAIRLVKSVGGVQQPVAKSTGENQLLSLSFVSALAQVAKEQFEARDKSDAVSAFEGGVYPIVMDSPFGTLDESPRRDVAAAIPKLAPQVIVLVSKSQGLGAVREELAPHIGKTYVIVYNSTKEDIEEELIDIDGVLLPYTSYSADGFEGANIEEVA
jgi:DNA sulfur modification protein DndD